MGASDRYRCGWLSIVVKTNKGRDGDHARFSSSRGPTPGRTTATTKRSPPQSARARSLLEQGPEADGETLLGIPRPRSTTHEQSQVTRERKIR